MPGGGSAPALGARHEPGDGFLAAASIARSTATRARATVAGSSWRRNAVLAATTSALSSNTSSGDVGVGAELAASHGLVGGLGEHAHPVPLVGGHAVLQRPGRAAQLSGGGREEAAARERPVLDVGQERLAQCPQPSSPSAARAGVDHDVDEQLASRVHRRELQVLLGAEVGVHAALADLGGARQLADAQPVEPLDRSPGAPRCRGSAARRASPSDPCAARRALWLGRHRLTT